MTRDFRFVLRRVGWTLIVLGTLDIVYMVYCIVDRVPYSSSLNIFAVIAGIFLVRGHLGAARLVAGFLAFALSAMAIASIALLPWTVPLDYWAVLFRLNPLGFVVSAFVGVAAIGAFLWAYQQLRDPAVIEAHVASGKSGAAPIYASAAGAILAVALTVMFKLTLGGGRRAGRSNGCRAVRSGIPLLCFQHEPERPARLGASDGLQRTGNRGCRTGVG